MIASGSRSDSFALRLLSSGPHAALMFPKLGAAQIARIATHSAVLGPVYVLRSLSTNAKFAYHGLRIRADAYQRVTAGDTVWMCIACSACTTVCPAQIPVTTSLMGCGAFPETHRLSLRWLGMHGAAFANFCTNLAGGAAVAVILAGTGFVAERLYGLDADPRLPALWAIRRTRGYVR